MRIVLFCPSWGELGGIERKAASLAAAFQQAGHDVAVLARGARHRSESEGRPPVFRLPLRHLPAHSRRVRRGARLVLHLPWLVASAVATLRNWRTDTVLSLAVASYSPYTIALARRFPLVFSIETAGPDFAQHPRALRWAFRSAAVVVGCASSLAAQARALAPEAAGRVVYVPNGVDVARFGLGDAASPHPRPYVLAVGRLTHQKGFDVLLDAWSGVIRTIPHVDLLVAGDGPDGSALRAQATRLGLGERVRFVGALDGDALTAVYQGARLLACPSRWEGLPLVCLEAMASGCPVVGAAVDGIPDAVRPGETGLLVPPEDARALRDAITCLLRDEARRAALATRAATVARTEFAWPVIAARYLALLDVARDPRRRGGPPHAPGSSAQVAGIDQRSDRREPDGDGGLLV